MLPFECLFQVYALLLLDSRLCDVGCALMCVDVDRADCVVAGCVMV